MSVPEAPGSMAAAPPAPSSRAHRAALWTVFGLVHGLIILLCFTGPGWPLGDVEQVYRSWAEGGASGRFQVGIDTPFVYPILAFVPIILALAFGPALYAATWLGMVTLLDAVAFAVLLRRPGKAAPRAAWWWLGFLALLGPVALARIDAVTVPIVILALLLLATRPLWGAALLTIGTWLKVWPFAALAALVVVSRQRGRVLATAAGTSAVIVLIALILGSGLTVFSFVTEQTGRGIQIESPVGLVWMWQAALDLPGSFLYYDREILTFQVTGPGIDLAIALMTPLLALTVAAVLLLGWRAIRDGASFERLYPPLLLALVVTLIAVNKVGSPQFIGWLAAPVIFGLVLRPRAWRTPAVLVAVMAGMTQLLYPSLYDGLLTAEPLMVLLLTLRNLLEFVLLGWAIREVWRSPAADRRAGLPRPVPNPRTPILETDPHTPDPHSPDPKE
ncbi:glycosyltransferase family 87 protein [Cryobacterium tagatosivorans]|nr:glycosyltransferase family 87 protein [Cryobacterium tagatosivorans]